MSTTGSTSGDAAAASPLTASKLEHLSTSAANKQASASAKTEVSLSSSLGWAGNYSKKMMALNWDYTCGPLRVVQVGPHTNHWQRLHAPGHSVLPRADGTLQHFKEQHRHVTDAELMQQVLDSGVGKVRKDPAEARMKQLSVAAAAPKDAEIDALRRRLEAQTVPMPPARPAKNVYDPKSRQPPVYDDASTIFSVSTTASKRTAATTTVVAAAAAAAASDAGSVVSRRSSSSSVRRAQQNPKQDGGEEGRPQSRQERVANEALSAVRSQSGSVKSELDRARRTLDSIERTMHERAAVVASMSGKNGGGGDNIDVEATIAKSADLRELQQRRKERAEANKAIEAIQRLERSENRIGGGGPAAVKAAERTHILARASESARGAPAAADATATTAVPQATAAQVLSRRELSNALNASRKALTPWC